MADSSRDFQSFVRYVVETMESRDESPPQERSMIRMSMTQFYATRIGQIQKTIDLDVAYVKKNKESPDEYTFSTMMSRQRRARKNKRLITCMIKPDDMVFKMIKQKLTSVKFEGNIMMFITKPIILNHTLCGSQKTLTIPMGRFKVICDFNYQTTRFSPYEHNVDSGDNRYHPHLDHGSNATACWGTYADPISKSYKSLNFSGLISLILDFLSTCDRQGWYQTALDFARRCKDPEMMSIAVNTCWRCESEGDDCTCAGDPDHCGDCDSHVDDCTCDNCGDCGEHNDNCECVKCPDDGEVLEGNSFPDSNCARCSALTRNLDSGTWQCGHGHHETGLENYTPPNDQVRNGRHTYGTVSNRKQVERSSTT